MTERGIEGQPVGEGINQRTDSGVLLDPYKREAGDYLGRKSGLAEKVMDWVRSHKTETSWAVIGTTLVTPVVANAVEMQMGEMASQNAVDDYLAEVGVKASVEVTPPGTVSPPEEIETPEVVVDDATPVPMPGPEIPTPTISDEEAFQEKVDQLMQISLNLGIKEKRTQDYRELLRKNGCREENVECCAGALFALNSKKGTDGFKDDEFNKQENSILNRYLFEKDVYEFGRTGEIPEGANFKVIYFKYKDGNETNVSAIIYVFDPDITELEVGEIEGYINDWEEMGAENFLGAMVANGLSVILHARASSGNSFYQYGDKILFCNSSKDDSSGGGGLRMAMGVEMFGVKGDLFAADLSKAEVSVLKFRLALDCCRYMRIKFGWGELLGSYMKYYEQEMKEYMEDNLPDMTPEEFEELVIYVKGTGVFIPFVNATWREINTLIDDNPLLKLQLGYANDEVLKMKKRLQELGYFRSGLELSDQYNDVCEERVKLFQQVNGITETGWVDEQTLTLLYSDTAIANQN